MFDRNLIAKALSKALKSSEHPNLTFLHWEVGKFTDPGIVNLSKALKNGSLPNLASFHLKGDKIDRSGVEALSKALKSGSLPNLASFHLKGDIIDYKSVEDSSKALKSTASSNKSLMQCFKEFKSDEANNQDGQHVPLMARNRLSSPDGSNNDQPGPSSRLSEMQQMLSGKLLSFFTF
ncbi:hypothetical protein JTE90_024160 [Oedothorax gibbosus]|uniref:Uncharacterized protein n=1 Tax=Oedothorax gibbosus TaxID=931172 RepID=A0AAV6TQS1_9ARAC|nr:hypothetical protein JTE90_024160 [Oedothorax gibbosus]